MTPGSFCSIVYRSEIYIGKNKVNSLVVYRNNNPVPARMSRPCFFLLFVSVIDCISGDAKERLKRDLHNEMCSKNNFGHIPAMRE